MNLPAAIRTVRWMVWDTFRQAAASKLLWVTSAVTLVCAAVCASVGVSGDARRQLTPEEVRARLAPDEIARIGLRELVREGSLAFIPYDTRKLTVEQRDKLEAAGRARTKTPDWPQTRYATFYGLELLHADGKLNAAAPLDFATVTQDALSAALRTANEKLRTGDLPPHLLVQLGIETVRDDQSDPAIAVLPIDESKFTPEIRERAEAAGKQKAANDGVGVISGEVTFGFGLMRVPLGKNREDAVLHLQVRLAMIVGDAAGILLALLWTAGFLPGFLEPQSATVLLAKPAPRWSILVGKYVGVVLFVGILAVGFIGSTWAALGFATGVWAGAYWLAVPLLAVNFAVFYAVSAFLAVWTRNGVVCAFGTILFWILCWAINYGHLKSVAAPSDLFGAGGLMLQEIGYWLLPKPLDLSIIYLDAQHGEELGLKLEEVKKVQQAGKFYGEASVAASVAFALGVLGLASYEFKMTDY